MFVEKCQTSKISKKSLEPKRTYIYCLSCCHLAIMGRHSDKDLKIYIYNESFVPC